jgi:hypothetical protein
MLGSFSRVALSVFEYIRFLSLQEEGVLGIVCELPASRPGEGRSADGPAVINRRGDSFVMCLRGDSSEISKSRQ